MKVIASMKTTYERKISSEEAEQEYFLVLKNRLSFFPEVGSSFSIQDENKTKRVKVESYICHCQGVELPHEHYFVKWKGLAKGDIFRVQKISDAKNIFSVTVN